MAVTKEYFNYIKEQLSEICGITYRQMMGEYIVYYKGKIAAYICDDRFLVKTVPSSEALLPGAKCEPPYDGAKNMLLVEETDDREFLQRLFEAMYSELPERKRKQD